jgi:hypothetical protein
VSAIKGEGRVSIKQRNQLNVEKTASSDKASDSEWLAAARSDENIDPIASQDIEAWRDPGCV